MIMTSMTPCIIEPLQCMCVVLLNQTTWKRFIQFDLPPGISESQVFILISANSVNNCGRSLPM